MSGFGADSHAQEFDHQREGHGKVDVPLVEVLAATFANQHHADQDQEGEGEHLDGGVAINKAGDGARGRDHDNGRKEHGDDHDPDVLYHADSGDD